MMVEERRTEPNSDHILSGELISAMEGSVYLVDGDGTMRAAGGSGWSPFADGNDASALTPQSVVGRSLFDMIEGSEVRDAYRRVHDGVLDGRRKAVSFAYRCDSPTRERHMRLAITRIHDDRRGALLLYQSQLISELPRLPMDLFSAEWRIENQSAYTDDQIVTLCSFCHQVAWPPGGRQSDREWVAPAEYYRRGGRTDHVISHGICEDCFSRVGAEDD